MSPSTLILLALLACMAVSAAGVTPSGAEMASARGWARAHLQAGAEALPFSFTYGGKQSAHLLAAWPHKRVAEKLEGGRVRTTTTWTDPAGGLQVRCVAVAYSDYPAVEWTLWFANKGGSDTALLQEINAIDAAYEGASGEPILHHNVGSPANKSDYSPLVTPLPQGASKRIGAAGGRPTNSDMSYFNLEWGGRGLIAAVGWPGQWSADFTHAEAGAVRLRAGQELTRFVLHPGEEVRSPLMALLWWQAGKGEDWVRGQNLWRRWMGAHSMPKPGGKLPPPQFVASSSRAYEEMIGANEANQIMHIDRYAELGLKLDYWWMDAGWYVQQQGWPQVGTWEVDPKRFPRGFKPISDRARDRGGRILVWFEPERVAPGTWLYETHPEWLLSAEPGKADAMAGLLAWRSDLGGPDPGVAFNSAERDIRMGGIHWKPGRLSFHPGPKGEYCVVRWTCPAAGEYRLDATFLGIDEKTTTDVHILQAGKPLFSGFIGLNGAGREAKHGRAVRLDAGEALDFVVGWGNGTHQCDSTGLEARLTGPDGSVHEAAQGFSYDRNPNGAWSYGWLPSGPAPDAAAFKPNTVRARGSDGAQKLLNLGNPEAWKWLVEHVDKLITDNGIGLYRQDFNIDPLGFWRANDEPDRQGITEIKHVMGYLAYWDELRRRHPDMLIDSCASGGRRNDLETMRRAVPLWRSDYAYEAIGHQCMTYGISMWLPYHGTGTVASDGAPYYGGGKTPVQPYAFWSNAAPSLGSGIDVREPDLDYDHLRKLLAAWRDLSQCYTGDYYPLTPTSQDPKAWIAWQFDLPERGEGAVQAFRRNECPDAEIRLKLKGIDPKATYAVRNLDTGIETTVSGRELADKGLRLTSAAAPEAFAIRYGRK